MYKITIEKVTTKKEVVDGLWTIVDKRPYTEKEAHDAFEPQEFAKELKEVRGYAPSREVTVTVEQTVLIQEVEELDIAKVIIAINKL